MSLPMWPGSFSGYWRVFGLCITCLDCQREVHRGIALGYILEQYWFH